MAETPKLATRAPFVLRNADLLFVFGLFGIVAMLILPIPSQLMDLLLTLSIGISLLILLIVVYIKDPPEFNVFPTILLAATLFRLGLNIASTRLILIDGYAGSVIDSFGHFVVQGNYVVGAVVFCILVIINFVVITKGAGRIAEVSARFTLDAMPGKQMAIDAELNAGLIDEPTARTRREAIAKEADFYGSMDGASKFVRGDAVAGILITIINVVGGISIGVFQKGLNLMDSLERYTLLSIGDGLVSQVPGLVISVAAGILVTRSADKENLGAHVGRQLTFYPRALMISGVMLLIFAILPGMPFLPFALLGGTACFVARVLKQHADKGREVEELHEATAEGGKTPKLTDDKHQLAGGTPAGTPTLSEQITVDIFSIELGFGLLHLADKTKGGELLERITGVRRTFATEMGIIVPTIAVRDNLELESNQYRILVRGRVVATATLMANRWMAINVGRSDVELKGVPTVEPAFGLDAIWVVEEERRNAEINGYTVVDATSVLVTHLSEILKEHAHLLLEREDVQKLLDIVKEKNPTLIQELLPDLVSVGLIQRVLQNLLAERIPVRNLTVILETVADFASFTKNPDELSEQVRKRLGLYFVGLFEADKDKVVALTLDPALEQALIPRIKRSQFELGLLMDPGLTEHLLRELEKRTTDMAQAGLSPTLVTTAELRLPFRRFFEPSFPKLNILSYQELPSRTQIESFGVIGLPRNLQNNPSLPNKKSEPELARV